MQTKIFNAFLKHGFNPVLGVNFTPTINNTHSQIEKDISSRKVLKISDLLK